ncbi:G2-specific protein kinase [Podosphaera aphanis]|nr:G2-specific protein kinase [Podosphaera aphanis]
MPEADKYDVLEKIGHGSFGIIRKVRRKQDGQILCRKEISYLKMSPKEREQLHAEFAILSSLRHPNIVGYYHREHLKSTQDLHLYMEYCGNGDLGRVIRNLALKNEYAEEGFVWSMFAQLVTALYRCHYGIDPPEPNCNSTKLITATKQSQADRGVTILHRDLKPENVFLGEDNSVKLGDFGLSKIMRPHDFASTYVGTPFYMSPEICAAERYTLKSDIWSLGCIMYELCSREPPFNAKTHFQLISKIKEGRVAPLPSIYSNDLKRVISDCLLVNPDRRPDTAALLKIPAVKLMRKEREVIALTRALKRQEELATRRMLEVDERARNLETEKIQIRQEIESTVRREWEVKAQLEINRLVQVEIQRLQKKFDQEVKMKVDVEVERRESIQSRTSREFSDSGFSGSNKAPLSSLEIDGDNDYENTLDLTEMSTDSPEPIRVPKKSARTPFSRAQTMFAGTPLDVEMAEPSPISIASLSLSPRRNGGAKAPQSGRNIFAVATGLSEANWQPSLAHSDDSDDDLPPVPSPTRKKPLKNSSKFTGERQVPSLQKTTTNQKNGLYNSNKIATAPSVPTLTNAPELHPKTSNNALRERSNSPNRRISRIPSSTSLQSNENTPISPQRKTSVKRHVQTGDLNKFSSKNMAIKSTVTHLAPKGRTLVELAQARAGGRSIGTDLTRSPEPRGRTIAVRLAEKSGEPTVWDPERDEMPSPFLVRARAPPRRM